MSLSKELTDIGTDIRDLLQRDPFQEKVQPECLREALLAYPLRGGKMMRPAICLWSCRMYGADYAAALPIAAAVELFHTWTLVHDDIIDADQSRRGGPSVHRLIADQYQSHDDTERFGINQAILTGDIQQAWSNHLILTAAGVSPALRLAIASRLNEWVNPVLISGEALDVEFEFRAFDRISSQEMETMLRWKTAVLLRFAAETGVMLGLGTTDPETPQVADMGAFAEASGLAFQLRDDLLGMFGQEDKLGKPVGSDLRQGKRTFLFASALERLTGKEADRFKQLLIQETLSDTELAQAQDLLTACGARETTESKAKAYHEEALRYLEGFPENRYRQLLREWADFIIARDY